ncbi:MAG: HAD hydrolase-like protein [Cyanobacteriota bacterium]
MIKAIIFDLDNCLSAADEPGVCLLEPVFDAIRRANRGTLPDDRLEAACQTILNAHCLSPAEVLVVGDNPDSELAAGNRLGICTVQTLRPGVEKSKLATHHIHTLGELKALVNR